MARIVLVTGGNRSGKSSYALEISKKIEGERYFIATALPFDIEMESRIKAHQEERGGEYCTIEEPYDIASAIESVPDTASVAVIDCLTVWLGNLFYRNDDNFDAVLKVVEKFELMLSELEKDITLIFVTNEVGSGVIPSTELSRAFCDMSGLMNQNVAKLANEVYFTTCGIPQRIK